MTQLSKNKSILIDSSEHQKVKQLADRFNITVKQYVEDMIDYGYKTGFNPTTMKRDRVMEKLNQIQESIKGGEEPIGNNIENLENMIGQVNQKINSILNTSNSIRDSIEGTIKQRLASAQIKKNNFEELIIELLNNQKDLRNEILNRYPKYAEGITGVIPTFLTPHLKKFIINFNAAVQKYNEIKNK